METTSGPSSPIPLVYAATVNGRLASRRAVVAAWAIPALVQAVGWIACFKRYPGDGPAVYFRNILAGVSGPSLAIASARGLVTPNSLPQYGFIAGVSWLVLLHVVCMRWARRVPMHVHIALSVVWEVAGWFLYSAMCY